MSEQKKSKKPLDPQTDNASQNDQIHAATTIQSSVIPEDYPAAELDSQADIVGKNMPAKRKADKEDE